ncbi:tribbles homolog 2-like [Centruroides vittatus]|uniref:Tribbles n=1 Tax=Centruroides hentzi TaxID=88313 RepID=A0A2I9LPV6_9SCOR|nr:tribbles homolog 2-like [Centruroides sculpturatus]
MNNVSRRPRLNLTQARLKQRQSFDKAPDSGAGSSGSLSPNLQPATPPDLDGKESSVPRKIGKYLLLERQTGSGLFRCLDTHSRDERVCKVVKNKRNREALIGHFRLDGHPLINGVEEVLVAESNSYIIFPPSYGDLHSYVRQKRRLREHEALGLFLQIASAVAACHQAGIVLRDLKLRKFVFKNPERTELKLETLDDAVVVEDDDWLNDRHGCPAYVSPEILITSGYYSGRAADCWSLGIMLYAMLVGRYPFHDADPGAVLLKVRRGSFSVPDGLSSHARCLIRSLLRMEPAERLTAEEVLDHPWFKSGRRRHGHAAESGRGAPRGDDAKVPDQTVPDPALQEETSSFFA